MGEIIMAQDWDYAVLSKAAKAAGGPNKYVEMIQSASKTEGKAEMLPVLGAAIAGTALLTAATIKVIEFFKEKKKQPNKAEIEQAKQELIDGINQYNAEHETDTEVGLEAPDDETETDRKKNDDE